MSKIMAVITYSYVINYKEFKCVCFHIATVATDAVVA